MKSKTWLLGWLILVLVMLCSIGNLVYKIDPYFHYHRPETETYFYTIDSQRSQNDGISKHFDYDALITGTSMTENFKTSEMDELFGCHSIKVPYSGGSYKEINDNLMVALKNNPNLKTIVRCLDMGMFLDEKDRMRHDLGTYPTYLYDDNPFNDIKYLFNKDVVFGRAYQMALENDDENFVPGITSFDDYSRWQYSYAFGIDKVCPDGLVVDASEEIVHLTDKEKEGIKQNIIQNVTSLADKYPDVDFHYFFSPYSVVWWSDLATKGTCYRQLEAERYIIELILNHDNIHLYSFNNRTDITTDINHYKDATHYGQWINSMILKWIYDGKYLLTKENYLDYLEQEYSFYTTFDYASINGQQDYESDFYAAALLNHELTGAEPIDILESEDVDFEINSAFVIQNQREGTKGIQCVGSLKREPKSKESKEEYILKTEYIGAKIEIDDLKSHDFLVFYGKKVANHGQPTVYVYDKQGNRIAAVEAAYQDLDNEWHQYVIDLSEVEGSIIAIFNGGYIDATGHPDSTYIFSNIMLY